MNAVSPPWPRLANLVRTLARPEYCFRPRQYWTRWRQRGHTTGPAIVSLPWGLQLSLRPAEFMHSQIWLHGVYDLRVTETMWRLLDAGELAIDAGANIGYMTSIMAARVGPAGRVIACEPWPENFSELKANAERWRRENGLENVVVLERALADRSGSARFKAPLDPGNLGLGALVDPRAEIDAGPRATDAREIEVKVDRLDQLVTDDSTVALLKIDVEGHELQVLRGAEKLLAAGRIRDIVFEEHRRYPTPVTRYLEQFGYQIFAMVGHFRGLSLCTATQSGPAGALDEPSLLATRDPARTEARFRKRGWHALRNHK